MGGDTTLTEAKESEHEAREVVLDRERLRDALMTRMNRKVRIRGDAVFPCLPALLDEIVERLEAVFATLGKAFSKAEVEQLRVLIDSQLKEGFAKSSLCQLKVSWASDDKKDQLVHYHINIIERGKAQQYEEWIKTRKPPLFGAHPDARVMDLAASLPPGSRIADLGAGTGRNTIPLALAGHQVDAIDATISFLEIIGQEAEAKGVDDNVTTTLADVGSDLAIMPRGAYAMVILSEVVPDLRELAQLRQIFTVASELLAPGGFLLFNTFVADPAYDPDGLTRELSQHHWCWVLTRKDLDEAAESLPFELDSDEDAASYEKARLPDWPPTSWYSQWAAGKDLFGLSAEEGAPMALHWLCYRRLD